MAVIALIATPIIMGVINDSKKGAAKDSMYSYIKAVELAQAKELKPETELLSGTYTTKDGNLMTNKTKVLGVDIKGTKPSDDGTVILTNGIIINADLNFNGYDITYNGKEVEITKPHKKYTIGEVVYFDPTGAVSGCASEKEWTPTNTNTTCYKWNIIKDNGNNVEMLLDHNTTAKFSWTTKADYIAAGGTEEEYGTNGNNKYGPTSIIKQLKRDTNNWTNVETLTSADNFERDNASSGTYTINYDGMKARLISGQEVADIAMLTNWTPTSGATSISAVSWLYQNTYNNGDNSNYGYSTDTARPSFVNYAFNVYYTGFLVSNHVSNSGNNGVRPVVRVLKSNI